MDTIPLIPVAPNPAKKNAESRITPENKKTESTSAARLLILQKMVALATNLVSSQLEAFSNRLADQLFKLSDQAVRPEEAKVSYDAHQLIKRNSTVFYRLVAGQINSALTN